MTNKKPTNPGTQVVSAAPSDELISSFIRRLKTVPGLEERTLEQWRLLEKSQPGIARFIMACSYQAAPDDPETRSAIASNMLYLYILLGEAKLHEELNETFGSSLKTYFS